MPASQFWRLRRAPTPAVWPLQYLRLINSLCTRWSRRPRPPPKPLRQVHSQASSLRGLITERCTSAPSTLRLVNMPSDQLSRWETSRSLRMHRRPMTNPTFAGWSRLTSNSPTRSESSTVTRMSDGVDTAGNFADVTASVAGPRTDLSGPPDVNGHGFDQLGKGRHTNRMQGRC